MSNRPKLSDLLFAELREQVTDGRLAPEARLPSEKALGEQFGVSRPIVRQALGQLRAAGLIQSRQGAGSFVAAEDALKAVSLDHVSEPGASAEGVRSVADVRHVYGFRYVLEGGAAFAAALARDERHLDRMQRRLDALDRAVEASDHGVVEDRDFHAAIAAATMNPFFVRAFAELSAQLAFVIDLSRTRPANLARGIRAAMQEEHHRILDRIREGDAFGARSAIEVHIKDAERRLFACLEV